MIPRREALTRFIRDGQRRMYGSGAVARRVQGRATSGAVLAAAVFAVALGTFMVVWSLWPGWLK